MQVDCATAAVAPLAVPAVQLVQLARETAPVPVLYVPVGHGVSVATEPATEQFTGA